MAAAAATHSREPIYLLRELYRHASCIFDDCARTYVKGRIRDRFRECRNVDGQRQRTLLHEGRKIASTLQRANAGDPGRLHRVLMMAYGRIGKRRHELMQDVVSKERGEAIIPGVRRSEKPIVTPELRALLKKTPDVKVIDPVIPQYNIWKKPFSLRREANIRWRHYTRMIAHVLPPLPGKELERLEKLVTGELKPIPPKRKLVRQKRDLTQNEDHHITPRFQRRMYRRVLAECPILKQRQGLKEGVIAFSCQRSKYIGRREVEADPEDIENVDEKGKRYNARNLSYVDLL